MAAPARHDRPSWDDLTPRERYIVRAVLRAIDEWERLQAGETATESPSDATEDARVDRLRASILREIG